MVRKILLAILAIVAVAIVVVLGLAMTKPDAMRIERKGMTAAAPATVFAILNDFHRFREWSPWEKLDPAVKVDYSGPQAGVGSSFHWAGNDKAGEGHMTITESHPDAHIAMDLEFIKPFAEKDRAEYMLAPSGAGTEVTWVMTGKYNMVSKVMCVFMDMDAMIGKDFEEGLAKLAKVAEATPTAAPDSTAAPAM